MKKIRVGIVTGTRAEFGIWRPVLDALARSKKLAPHLLVTGMHLLKDFGNTANSIEAQGYRIAAKVPMYKRNEPPADSLARATKGLADAYRHLHIDLVLVLGDRLEMLAAANAALAQRIPIAHVHGGETAPGIWDEQIRHALTKMAHLHFCSTKAAARRIRQMGENPARIHQVGAPALDTALAFTHAARRIIPKIRLIAGTHPLILLHPSSPDDDQEYRRTLMLLDALQKAFDDPPTLHAIGPNNDPGHRGILRAYKKRDSTLHLLMSSTQNEFWLNLLSSGLLIGNSSAGIIEAATFAIPVINLGDRQAGRERNPNLLDVPWSAGQNGIEKALHLALTNKPFARRVAARKNLYGDGHTAQRIVKVLESLPPAGLPIEKRFADL